MFEIYELFISFENIWSIFQCPEPSWQHSIEPFRLIVESNVPKLGRDSCEKILRFHEPFLQFENFRSQI